jgi:hypothetical protein
MINDATQAQSYAQRNTTFVQRRGTQLFRSSARLLRGQRADVALRFVDGSPRSIAPTQRLIDLI